MSSANRSRDDDLLLVQVTLVKTSGTLEEIRREDARTLGLLNQLIFYFL